LDSLPFSSGSARPTPNSWERGRKKEEKVDLNTRAKFEEDKNHELSELLFVSEIKRKNASSMYLMVRDRTYRKQRTDSDQIGKLRKCVFFEKKR